jgi:heme exporter protein B
MNAPRQILALIGKDLRIEGRNRTTLAMTILVGVLVVVIFGLGAGGGAGVDAVTVLWAAYLLSGVLCAERTMACEHESDALEGLLLTPVDRGVVYLAKLATNLVLMAATAAVVTLAGVVLFGFDMQASPWAFALVVGLGLLGVAAVGTLLAAAVGRSGRGGSLLLLAMPLCLPVVVVSTRLAGGLGEGGGVQGVGVLIAFDVVYLAASWLVFEFLLES